MMGMCYLKMYALSHHQTAFQIMGNLCLFKKDHTRYGTRLLYWELKHTTHMLEFLCFPCRTGYVRNLPEDVTIIKFINFTISRICYTWLQHLCC